MNSKNIIRYIPFLSTLIIVFFLFFSNQKENTKLKILIWNTPLLSLGSYIGISISTGFILSYFTTTSIAKFKQSKFKNVISYKSNTQNESNIDNIKMRDNISYENTLFERDINEPSPTVNACFRVIGKTNRKIDILKDKDQEEYDNQQFSNKSEQQYYENETQYDFSNTTTNDWGDDSYANW